MRNSDLLKNEDDILRVLDVKDEKALVMNCKRKTMPKWVDCASLSDYSACTKEEAGLLSVDFNSLDANSRKLAHERFTLIAGILPFVADKKRRCSIIAQIADDKNISNQTIEKYLWLYLTYQDIAALAPKSKEINKELTADEKNIRWALNKFFYTRYANSLNTTYTLMLKEKYCDGNGQLLEQYPSFHQFRYYYRKHKSLQTYYISRNGLKHYQRNNRPLLGDGIQQFAPAVGVGMLDATICDIYLVNESGGLVGRPILTACIDAYSGLCCGYTLSWEGGVYSLRSLLVNVIADKTEWCRQFGISIEREDWNCSRLPATLVTDMGKEYASDTFEQIADLGVTLVNLPPYRPELKGAVEKFFDVIQGLYKPHLRGKGVIETDFQERGAHDYRKDASLTMADFEKVILWCIVYYNSQRVLENFPYTDEMLTANIKPSSSAVWNYSLSEGTANLISVDYKTLVLTLFPRTTGRFTRKGLVVNKLRYRNEEYTERYLSGGVVTVAYNPENVSEIWLLENGAYSPFTLVESRFSGMDIANIEEVKTRQKALVGGAEVENIQAKISLIDHIEVIANSAIGRGKTEIAGVRDNRKREQNRAHIDYLKGGVANG